MCKMCHTGTGYSRPNTDQKKIPCQCQAVITTPSHQQSIIQIHSILAECETLCGQNLRMIQWKTALC